MKIKHWILALVMMFSAMAMAADRLAVAEPIYSKKQFSEDEARTIWAKLEATVDGGYELISRQALSQMMTEIGLTCSSDLVNMTDAQKAKMGQLKTVKYLLITNIGKIGTELSVAFSMIDASTGEIMADHKDTQEFEDVDEFFSQLKDMLTEIGLGPKLRKRGKSAILYPIVKVADAPDFLATDFNVYFENCLLQNGVKLTNLKTVKEILTKKKIGNLDAAAPAMFRRIGELLRVDNLIQVTINDFRVTQQQMYIAVTRQYVMQSTGTIAGNVRIISASTGDLLESVPFEMPVDFNQIPEALGMNAQDCSKLLIKYIVPQISQAVLAKLK